MFVDPRLSPQKYQEKLFKAAGQTYNFFQLCQAYARPLQPEVLIDEIP